MAPLFLQEAAMGVNLSIKSVPDEWAERLRQRAERNHRSLQGELMALLEQAVQAPAARALPLAPELPGLAPWPGSSRPDAPPAGSQRGTLSVEDISRRVSARYAGQPAPAEGLASSVEIVREMRDSRWS
jgi:hypothetical protein